MLKKVINFFRKQNSLRYIAFGFLAVIFIGSGLLMIPGCIKEGITLHYYDALFTSTSAVCVTGLIVVDVADTFTIAGQVIVMLLIQIGGLGVTTLGAGLVIALRRHISLKERNILQETLNLDDAKSLFALFKRVFIYTFAIEITGACLSMITFFKAPDYAGPSQAVFRSFFHSIAAFNNSGFDIMGNFTNFTIAPYNNDIFFNLLTCILIILGGLGFLVISDTFRNITHFKKTSLHTKVVLMMTFILLVSGTLLIALTEYHRIRDGSFTWLGAFFASVTSRTAGFSTYNFAEFTRSGQIIVILLMFIGASPGSTGGGIKTTTLFVLIMGVRSIINHKKPHAFKYSISEEAVKKALSVAFLSLALVITGTFILCMIEREYWSAQSPFSTIDAIFEVTSAFGTVGLSTGLTPLLSVGSKMLLVIIMYLGRVGPLTFMSSLYSGKDEYFSYAEGVIPIG